MRKVIQIAQERGWKSSLHDYVRKKNYYLYGYSSDITRADWKILLPKLRNATILDYGCGWGSISISLSQGCGKIIALDSTYERVQFLNIRRTQEKISNLYPVCAGDTFELPFPNSYFDVIILNGVLEWIGATFPYKGPSRAQVEFLRSLWRVLKKDGCLYIGIENRFGLQYLLGARDHSKLRFTSVLPRNIARILSQLFLKQNYYTYTYSYKGYKILLEKSGFAYNQFYSSLPRYRAPSILLPLDNSVPFNFLLKSQLQPL
ncbi:MAG: class I SAM-dependent methyltransferase, partial [Candidatus Aerophobetes bacterium]|nr:class I SAM-dependent methyltransferase [Candidatus Aerophobetes bacterium]